MALTKGNYSGNNMPQGMTDEQNRELQRGLILLQMRRYLRFFWIGLAIIGIIQQFVMTDSSLVGSLLYGVIVCGIGYALTVGLFVYLLANFGIKIFLYLKSLFGGEARL